MLFLPCCLPVLFSPCCLPVQIDNSAAEDDDTAATFAELARRYSSCPSKRNGGSLGECGPGEQPTPHHANAALPQHLQCSCTTATSTVRLRHCHSIYSAIASLPQHLQCSCTTATASTVQLRHCHSTGLINNYRAPTDAIAQHHPRRQQSPQLTTNHGCTINRVRSNWLSSGAMVPPFDAVLWAAPIGVVQGPVRTEFGYHLILVSSRTEDKQKPN